MSWPEAVNSLASALLVLASASQCLGEAETVIGHNQRMLIHRFVDRRFAGLRYPPDMILAAVRGYLRYAHSYRDVEEPLAELGVLVDHLSVYRWAQRCTLLLIGAETSLPVSG